jgi:hypothetical protein
MLKNNSLDLVSNQNSGDPKKARQGKLASHNHPYPVKNTTTRGASHVN